MRIEVSFCRKLDLNSYKMFQACKNCSANGQVSHR